MYFTIVAYRGCFMIDFSMLHWMQGGLVVRKLSVRTYVKHVDC